MPRKKKTITDLENDAAVVRRELELLDTFRKQTRTLLQLRSALEQELASITRRMEVFMPRTSDTGKDSYLKHESANLSRSNKMKRYSRYIKQMRDTWAPDMSIPEVKSDYKAFRRGEPSKLGRIQYFNPSL